MKSIAKYNPTSSVLVSTMIVVSLLLSPVILAADPGSTIERNTLFFNSPPSAQEIGEHLFLSPPTPDSHVELRLKTRMKM